MSGGPESEGLPSGGRSPGGSAGEPRRLSRRERELRRHRRDVLAATECLLRDHGFHDITVQQIAEQAEFSVGYLYKLFANREEIFIALMREKKAAVLDIFIRELAATTPVPKRLHDLIHRLFAWTQENADYAKSSVRDLARFADLHERLVAEETQWHAEIEGCLQAFCTEAVGEGVLQGDPQEMATILGSLLSGYIWERLTRGDNEENWTRYADLIAIVFLRAFAPDHEEPHHA